MLPARRTPVKIAAQNRVEKSGIDPMHKSNEYRAFAAHCLTFAKSSPDTIDKTRLLTMAEAWLDLADRRTRVVKSACDGTS